MKNILLLLLYPKLVIKLLGYNLGCYKESQLQVLVATIYDIVIKCLVVKKINYKLII